jgi:hypothetical protein
VRGSPPLDQFKRIMNERETVFAREKGRRKGSLSISTLWHANSQCPDTVRTVLN